MKAIALKGVISLALFLTFLVATFTGIGLWFAPHGRGSSYWTFLGISKEDLRFYHRISSVIFVMPAFVHFAMNFKMLLAELKTMVKK